MDIDEVLKRHKRVAVVGGPSTRKSKITDAVTDRPVYHSDDMPGDWKTKPDTLINRAAGQESFVIAGVTADRAIRKGLEVDAVIHCTSPSIPYSRGQATLKKQIDKRAEELSQRIPTYRYNGEGVDAPASQAPGIHAYFKGKV